jgi:predicted DNA repair protein MutK
MKALKRYTNTYPHHHSENRVETTPLTEAEILLLEKDKIKSAVVTDFILSVEIVIIALGLF